MSVIFNSVDWEPVTQGLGPIGDYPYATHKGSLIIGGHVFRCYRLSDGESVIDADDVHEFLEAMLPTPSPQGQGESR